MLYYLALGWDGSVEVFSDPVTDLLNGNSRKDAFLLLSFTDAFTGQSSPTHVHYLSLYKDANLLPSKVDVVGVEATDDPTKLTVSDAITAIT